MFEFISDKERKKKKRKETLNDILLFGYKLYTHTRARQVSRE